MLKNGSFVFLILILFSCSKENSQTYITNINGSWNKKQTQKIQFKIDDAQNPKNIIFVVRNNDDYPYSNLRLIVNFESPNKKSVTDTLNYILAKPNGEWLGTGFGETKEILFQYKMNYKLPENGLYKISVKQAMRKDILPGIEDLGLKIEQAKP
ncbi:gliding motility-associated lipoprotein GldH [Halpernia humi]|uniref:Gliding motility-associated lipoprotein GldH n=1 Tax=Halpernia humi TaxID=493375 RepID=A0A1H5Y7Y5_9FLAO|nr:gliding motility lipoprotein GldH [Halpernia humi]SEG19942.1 gliding motility-associated lipoprotein GldH [Halpernia humi]